ncbi:MAG: TonB-dependent receptor, partial [Gammaproteobacteria bacterium]|nr:TonB-dependent receptor [Gammaproteobacteria bacterium]
ALHDLQRAISLNDSQAVYRSRLLVDEDLAARSAGVGRLHSTLGFEQLALVQGRTAVTEAPGDYSGHRLLADVYAYLPRHQIARVNELFQSQLMQPLSVTPVRPQLAESNLFILDTAGPSTLAFQEFQPLLRENGITVQGSAVTANRGTRGFDAAVAGLHDKVSYSIGHFDFETDGFRPNNDLAQRATNAFVQVRPRPETGVIAELRSNRVVKGDLKLLFDPESYSAHLRQKESVDSIRVGVRQQINERGTLLAAAINEDIEGEIRDDENGLALFGPRRGHSVDVQYIHEGDKWLLVAGGRRLTESLAETIQARQPLPPFEDLTHVNDYDLEQSSLYTYGNVPVTETLDATFGASLDQVETRNIDRSRLNPKVGLLWRASPSVAVRAAAFRTLRGPLVSKYNIRPSLEPTHVVGFNQQFFGSDAEIAWNYGASLDYRRSEDLYFGLELVRRDLQVPAVGVPPGGGAPFVQMFDVQETMRRAYSYWTPTPRISTGVTYQYEQFDNGGYTLSDGLTRVRTHRIPIDFNYFHPSGFSAGITTTFVDQAGEFGPMQFGPDPLTEHGEDRFWVTDLSLGYRLPSRHGLISLNVHNLLDEDFRFQDADPENPRILPERMLMLKLTVSF